MTNFLSSLEVAGAIKKKLIMTEAITIKEINPILNPHTEGCACGRSIALSRFYTYFLSRLVTYIIYFQWFIYLHLKYFSSESICYYLTETILSTSIIRTNFFFNNFELHENECIFKPELANKKNMSQDVCSTDDKTVCR